MANIKLANVRLSFPNLFQTSTFGGDDTGKYDATFLLDKKIHKKEIDEIQEEIDALTTAKFKGKALPEDKVCLKDGDATEREEQQGMMVIKASSKRRPTVVDNNNPKPTPLVEEDNRIYAGCYVNAIISLWAQNNAFGKRINASLEGVQYWRNGEPFGPPAISADEFDAFGTSDEEIAF